MTDRNTTICAVSTPQGIGGIAVIRISGPEAVTIADTVWKGTRLADTKSHTAHLGYIIDHASDRNDPPLDQAVATVYRAPGSFTGEDVVEFSVHGSKYIQRRLIEILKEAGCRIAEPGEFTRRAFVSGKMDLTEAEAIADVIAANSRAAHRIAAHQMRGDFSKRLASLRARLIDLASLLELELDFSEEDVEFASRKTLRDLADKIHTEISRLEKSFAAGNAIKEGIPVAIVGATNAGKSSLLNILVEDDRAIVSDIHGTTRDTVEETIDIGDCSFRFIDTAGLRNTDDIVEQKGIERSRLAMEKARIIIAVADITDHIDIRLLEECREKLAAQSTPGYLIIALNKIDIPTTDTDIIRTARNEAQKYNGLAPEHAWVKEISTLRGDGIEELRRTLMTAAEIEQGTDDEGVMVTNIRHATALSEARKATARVIQSLNHNLSGDLIAQDLRETLSHLASITGDIPSSEILNTIFSRFCVGK